MFWCFQCYAVNDHPSGPCGACGKPVEAPRALLMGRQPDLDVASPRR